MSGSKCKSDGDIPGITTLFIVLYHSFKNVLFLCLVMYYLFDKYYKLITVQCYIADCVSWVPKTWANKPLLDIRTSWTYKCDLRMEPICMSGA